MQEDPFTVPLEEKVALLMEATRRMQSVRGPHVRRGGARLLPPLDLVRLERRAPRSSRWCCTRAAASRPSRWATVTCSAAAIRTRSVVTSRRRATSTSARSGLIEEAERIGQEAVDLLNAPECPSEVTTLVLDSGQMELQIHESIGHPIELDRVLGMEEAYAGASWLTPGDRGKVRYASDLVSITADATLAGWAGHVRVRRRGRAGADHADHRRRHVRELPDLAGRRRRWWARPRTPRAAPMGGATCR